MSKASSLTFSTSGAAFAVASATLILLHTTETHAFAGKLRGHMSAITAIRWSADDRTLASVSAGGDVYLWDAASCTRLRDVEHVDKASHFCDLRLAPDGACATVRAAHGAVQQVALGGVQYTVSAPQGDRLPIVLAGGGEMLLAGAADGAVHAWPWPKELPAPACYQRAAVTAAHAAPLRHMCVAGGGSLLVTAGADGTVLVWALQVCVLPLPSVCQCQDLIATPRCCLPHASAVMVAVKFEV